MNLDQLKLDCAINQKKGIHFIIASIVIWILILLIHSSNLPIIRKNLLTFCASAPLMPLSYFISKILNIKFSDKNNPLNHLGFLFSLNQILYLLIVMWVYSAQPKSMLMVYAMVFGAHLLPYSWLYSSLSYRLMAIVVPLLSLIIGLTSSPVVLATFMVIIEIIFVIALYIENKKNNLNLRLFLRFSSSKL